jgi:CubicO group peptidase (beta-lactamase class C family)
VLVARRGRLVLEEYFHGYTRETQHDIRSVGKTFASIMLGAAMESGAPISPETRVYDLMAGLGPFANPDPRRERITIAHLLTHTAGLACNDNDDNSPGSEGVLWRQSDPNLWRYTLNLPQAHEPGERYAYCSANLNLVGGALNAATGESLPELFDRVIARPLQFGPYFWNVMPNGEGYLGGGAFMRPRDLLKVGQTYLDGGVWNGRRVVSRDWVERSTSPRVTISPETTGLSEEEFSNFYGRGVDGYAWHRNGVRVGDRVVESYEANGNGGQLLVVVPEYDLVVVFTGANYMQGGIWTRWRDEYIGGVIIPAMS